MAAILATTVAPPGALVVTHAMLRRLTSWRCIIIIINVNSSSNNNNNNDNNNIHISTAPYGELIASEALTAGPISVSPIEHKMSSVGSQKQTEKLASAAAATFTASLSS